MTTMNLDQYIDPPLVIERGKSSDVLVIGFAGFGGWLATHPTYFYNVASLLPYSRIMLRDPTRTAYLDGIPPVAPGYHALLALLRQTIEQFSPKKILVLGTSGGGFGALLYGHALKADYVHAFAPFTYADMGNVRRYEDRELRAAHRRTLERLQTLPEDVQKLFDLEKVLRHDNGKTRYFVHYCAMRANDEKRAKHIEECPNVTLIAHPCNVHQVVEHVAMDGLLAKVLDPVNQDRVQQLVKQGGKQAS